MRVDLSSAARRYNQGARWQALAADKVRKRSGSWQAVYRREGAELWQCMSLRGGADWFRYSQIPPATF